MKSGRIYSIDIFRGFTIFMMIFVNDLAGVSAIPDWMKHVAADVDGMTFVDVVFPAFLFIVGMAIPWAVEHRLEKGHSYTDLTIHTLIRTISLLVMGVYMVNSAEMNDSLNLIPHRLWSILLYVAIILIWNRYPATDNDKTRFRVLQGLGMLLLLILYFTFRKGTPEDPMGMTTSWWGILGLIGWAYLISMLFYVPFRQSSISIFIIILLLWSIEILLLGGWFVGNSLAVWLEGQIMHLTHTFIVMTGIAASIILKRNPPDTSWRQVVIVFLLYALTLYIMGYVSTDFGGISKIAATPAWGLYSASICTVLFGLIYWITDVRGWKSWADFLKPAGENPLLCYILPSLFYAIVGYGIWPDALGVGAVGFLRAIVFAVFIVWIGGLMTRWGIKLKL